MQLEQAWDYLNDAKYKKAAELCEDYFNEQNKALAIEAHKIAGLAYFRLKDYKKASEHYQKVAEFTNNSFDWFQLSTSAVLSHQMPVALNAFEQALSNYEERQSEGTIPVPNMRLFFMQSLAQTQKWKKAFEQLNALREIYQGHEITDESFLYLNGVPSLQDTLNAAVEVFNNNLSNEQTQQWLNDFASELDEEGQEMIANYIQKYNFKD